MIFTIEETCQKINLIASGTISNATLRSLVKKGVFDHVIKRTKKGDKVTGYFFVFPDAMSSFPDVEFIRDLITIIKNNKRNYKKTK